MNERCIQSFHQSAQPSKQIKEFRSFQFVESTQIMRTVELLAVHIVAKQNENFVWTSCCMCLGRLRVLEVTVIEQVTSYSKTASKMELLEPYCCLRSTIQLLKLLLLIIITYGISCFMYFFLEIKALACGLGCATMLWKLN